MNVLVINAGSSSLKYQLINMVEETTLAVGICERIGLQSGIFVEKFSDGSKRKTETPIPDHVTALRLITAALVEPERGALNSLNEIDAIGHRVVQGGSKFDKPALVNDEVLDAIERLIPLAPLHNKPQLATIKACTEVFGNLPQAVVFDTSFHTTIPPKAFLYAVPYEYYEKYQIRRYGFHGTSHKFVSARCAELMQRPLESMKVITCHIGSGSSITAIQNGKVIDTSMGFTPLDGFMMGTRSGSIDPSVVTFIMEKENLTPKQMEDLLNKQSGMLGISGISSDDRDIEDAEKQGHQRAILAHEMLAYQIIKTIGGYVAAMNGVDAIIFTAGLGENQTQMRSEVCAKLTYLGIEFHGVENSYMRKGREGLISSPESKVAVWVIPTNEELVIARDTKAVIELAAAMV